MHKASHSLQEVTSSIRPRPFFKSLCGMAVSSSRHSSGQSPFEQDLSSSPSPMQKVPPSQVRVLCCTPSPHDSEQVDHSPHIAQKPSSVLLSCLSSRDNFLPKAIDSRNKVNSCTFMTQ